MRYMISPLDLETEEFEIYRLLYKKMDFETYEVKYTLDQLVSDSNSKLKITKKKTSNIIKKFIADDLLSVTRKGSKGNPTIYKVSKIAEIEKHKGDLKETQRELKGNTKETNKASDTNGLIDSKKHKGNTKETQREFKGNTKALPINEKEKEKEKDIYTTVYDYYISLELVRHRGFTPAMKKAINLAIKENKYTSEDMKDLLFRHKQVVEETKNNGKFAVRIRKLDEFFGQKIQGATSLICTQYEVGGKYYKSKKVESEQKADNIQVIPREEKWSIYEIGN